jgi:hypothetical protein
MEFVENPQTQRMIKVGTPYYRKLVAQGIIVLNVVPLDAKKVESNKSPPKKVKNPETGRLIDRNGALYKKLLKAGVNFHDDDIKVTKTKKGPKCLNDNTYIMMMPTTDLDPSDIFQLPSGHCFSIEELTLWIKSKTFTNINPYSSNELFNEKDKKSWSKDPALIEVISDYFKSKRTTRQVLADILITNMDIIFDIGNAGRICLWDNRSSWEATNSSVFEYSIETLSELNEKISNLDKSFRKPLEEYTVNNMTIKSILQDAEMGNLCIHGIGAYLIGFMIELFLMVLHYHPRARYNPIKSNVAFVKRKVGQVYTIVIQNMDTREVFPLNTLNYKVLDRFDDILLTTKCMHSSPNKRGRLTPASDLKDCHNEAMLSTLDSLDTWDELTRWRVLKTGKTCFDLMFIIKVITDQLNGYAMTNPKPRYPTNPFTMMPFNIRELIQIRRAIFANSFEVSPPLRMFMSNVESLWSDDIHYVRSSKWLSKAILLFETDMRSMRELVGYGHGPYDVNIRCTWVHKTQIVSSIETMVINYINEFNESLLPKITLAMPIPNNYYFSFRKQAKNGYRDKDLDLLSGIIH